jgi:Fur family ferric uptake transcriptional regulator
LPGIAGCATAAAMHRRDARMLESGNKDTTMQLTSEQRAESLIRATGARLTRPRTRVLMFLLDAGRPLTHHEIHDQLPGEALDTVTLYRVLEWLTAHGMVHRIAGADQVWRFSTSAGKLDHDHAHFQCTSCDSVTCFNDTPLPRRVKMPAGFTSQEVDFLIKGTCPRCSSAK